MAFSAEPSAPEGAAQDAASTPPALTLHGVEVRYPGAERPALVVDRLAIGRGERVAVIGPSGSGKTTLLRLLNGTLAAERGEIFVLGKRLLSGRRPPSYAGRAMVATSHPLASAAGLQVLAEGGNAVDAAIAASAVQAVVDPLMTGIGGDCFALYAPAAGPVRALNGSGRAPAAASVQALREAGLTDAIPQGSPHAVTVPGAISAWCRLHADLGRLPLSRLFRDAIAHARDGFVVTPRVAQDWAESQATVAADPHAAAHFLPVPAAGGRFAQPLLADRLEEVAAHGPAAFYQGATAARMVAHLRSLGGLHSEQDFAEATDGAEWVAPISAAYRGFDIHECPPNGQGLAALLILKIIEGFDMAALSPADRIHVQAEATKLAYHHRDELLGDPDHCAGLTERLLSEPAIAALRARIDMGRAQPPALWDEPEHRDTIYLCVVDAEGNAVSFINSIFHGFGSGLLDPATGVLFQSRGASFRLIPGHPNAISACWASWPSVTRARGGTADLASSSRKCCARIGMSARRSRSAGMRTGMTLRR